MKKRDRARQEYGGPKIMWGRTEDELRECVKNGARLIGWIGAEEEWFEKILKISRLVKLEKLYPYYKLSIIIFVYNYNRDFDQYLNIY